MKITDALEKYLISSNYREESPNKERKFYISDMGKCMRVRWLKRKGISTEFSPFVYWTFAMGDMIHDYGYKALQSQGILLEAEDYVSDDHFIGRFDGIVKDGNKKAPFDFKSVKPYKMKLLIDGNEEEDNISQLLTYTLFLQRNRKDIGDASYVVYINKEPDDKIQTVFHQKVYHLTNYNRGKIEEEMKILTDLWLEDKVPACSCVGWERNYNSYLPLCTAKDTEIREYLKYMEAGKKLVSTKEALYLIDGEVRKEIRRI